MLWLKGHYDNTFKDFTYKDFAYKDFTYKYFTYKDFTYKDFTYKDFTQTFTKALLKGKAQYSWPPCTNQLDQLLLILKTLFTFLQNKLP